MKITIKNTNNWEKVDDPRYATNYKFFGTLMGKNLNYIEGIYQPAVVWAIGDTHTQVINRLVNGYKDLYPHVK